MGGPVDAEHAGIAEALGAWALDACPEDEAQVVEAHLTTCPVCAREASRLRRVAAELGGAQAVAPPARLREVVLAAVRARQPAQTGGDLPTQVRVEDAGAAEREPALAVSAAAYAAEVAGLDALLDELVPEQWRTRGVHGWTVQELLAHLATADGMLTAQLGPEPDAPEPGGTLESRTVDAIVRHRRWPAARTRAAWRTQADGVLRFTTSGGPETGERPVRLTDSRLPRQPLRLALVQRAFETRVHADDVRAALGQPPRPPAPQHLTLVAGLGVRLLPAALRLAGGERPGRTAQLLLDGPGGGSWTVPLSPATPAGRADVTVTLGVAEFCSLMANRRSQASLAHTVTGDAALAADLLRAVATLGCD